MTSAEKISKSIRSLTDRRPSLALILGSGLGDFAGTLEDPTTIATAQLDGYPASSIEGHAGKLVFGTIRNKHGQSKEVLVFQGRVHLYESGDPETTILPIMVAHELGIKRLILTNASGGLNPLYSAGDLMLIRDYINTTSENPLIAMRQFRFVSNELYRISLSDFLIQKTIDVALESGIPLRQGTYCWVKGPSYETASEIRMLRRMGGDAVGMSTVPEILAAVALGIETVGISCITNMATGLGSGKLSHVEVTETANRVKTLFSNLLTALALEIG